MYFSFPLFTSTILKLQITFLWILIQTQKNATISTLQLFRRLVSLRQEPSFQKGSFRFSVINKEIFSFVRHLEGDTAYLVVLNVGKKVQSCDLSGERVTGKVLLVSCNIDGGFNEGEIIKLKKVTLKPGDGIVLEWDYLWYSIFSDARHTAVSVKQITVYVDKYF